MKVTNITAWIKKDTKMEPASVPMAFRIGECTFFLNEDAKGIEKITELIEVLESVRTVGATIVDETNRRAQEVIPQEVEDMELIEDGE